MTNDSQLELVWTVWSPAGRERLERAALHLDTRTFRPVPGLQHDAEVLEMIRSAGLHLDQAALAVPSGAEPHLLEGHATASQLAGAIADFVRDATYAVVVDARSHPIRVTEVPEVPARVLVMDIDERGPRQIPPNAQTIADAFGTATVTRPSSSASPAT